MDRKILLSPYENPYFFTQPPTPPSPATATATASDWNKVSPSVLLIIIILAIIFFISGLLHLLVRFLVKPSSRDPDEFDNVSALQGQLQQLFNLHDSGVDQSFVDSLPVFNYKSIIGVKKNPFDCAVCLCEFEGEDMLRLLPKCSHAFHMDCIDTWLLSHSTCPLCRSNLISDYTPNSCFSPIVLVLESATGESSREIVAEPPMERVNSHLSSDGVHHDEFELDHSSNSGENEGKTEVGGSETEKVVRIRLGKYKNMDGGNGGGGGEKRKIDGRRCFSMGSFEYIMDENSSLQVPIPKQASKKMNLPITAGHRSAVSECGGDSKRDFKGIESNGGVRRESFSVSKIWLRGKKEKPTSTPPRGSFSLRFLLRQNVAGDASEVESCDSFNSQAANLSSFGRRTLLWLMGRQQNKLLHSSFATNI